MNAVRVQMPFDDFWENSIFYRDHFRKIKDFPWPHIPIFLDGIIFLSCIKLSIAMDAVDFQMILSARKLIHTISENETFSRPSAPIFLYDVIYLFCNRNCPFSGDLFRVVKFRKIKEFSDSLWIIITQFRRRYRSGTSTTATVSRFTNTIIEEKKPSY